MITRPFKLGTDEPAELIHQPDLKRHICPKPRPCLLKITGPDQLSLSL